MKSLFYKEIITFFSSIIGYLVIIVFLLINSLLLWIIPGIYNITESGYASLKPFFEISPWVFLFLVSAVCMRMFAEEKKQGTFELLITRPLTEMQLIIAKYSAALVLVTLALIPSFIYYLSIYFLGNPVGNIDTASVIGAYIGLFFLASIYAAIAIFASSLTDNQVIAFIIAVFTSLFFYIGFDVMALLPIFSGYEGLIIYLGINEHYKSISRGVIDSKDVVYFVSVIAIFLFSTRMILQKRS